MTSTPSRRAIVRGAAAVMPVLAGATTAAIAAGPPAEPDPIFAVIARCREAVVKWGAAVSSAPAGYFLDPNFVLSIP